MRSLLIFTLILKTIIINGQPEKDCSMVTNLLPLKCHPSYYTNGVYNHANFIYFHLKGKNSFARYDPKKMSILDTLGLDSFLNSISTQVLKITYPDSIEHPVTFNRLQKLRDSLFRGKAPRLGSNELEFELYNFSYANGFVFLNYGFFVPWPQPDGRVQTRRVIVILKCNEKLKPLDWYCSGFLKDYGPASIAYDKASGSYFTRTVSDQKDKEENILYYTKVSLEKGRWTLNGHLPLKVSEDIKEKLHVKSNSFGEISSLDLNGTQYFWTGSSPILTTTKSVLPAFDTKSKIETLKYRRLLGVHVLHGKTKRVLVVSVFTYYGKYRLVFTLLNSDLKLIKETYCIPKSTELAFSPVSNRITGNILSTIWNKTGCLEGVNNVHTVITDVDLGHWLSEK